MEVHHHAHHEGKKNWMSYFWEFLMLFLAVFCGFMAENVREHMVNGKNERKLVAALQKDLIADTAHLHQLIYDFTPAIHAWVDSAHYDIDSLPLKGNERRIGKALFNVTYWDIYAAPEVAVTIMKNPVAFNLIENEDLKKELLEFNGLVNSYNSYSAFLDGMHHALDTSFASLVNREAGRKYLDGLNKTLFFLTDQDLPDSVLFKTYDKNVFLRYLNMLDPIDAKMHDIHYYYKDILKKDLQMLHTIQKEYHMGKDL